MAKFFVKSNILRNGIFIAPFSTIELTDEADIRSLLEVGAIGEGNEETIAQPPEPLATGDEEIIAMDSLSIGAATALIEKTTDLEQLHIYKDDETTGKARKAVLSAIDKQISSQAN
jgi:hypothetical protein